jgi:ADP-ribose pyrophosphatase YjhB (NUDIX family)
MALVHEGRVLFCRNVEHGYLYLPGGHVEFGEAVAAAAEREVMEELGVCVRAGELVLISEGHFVAGRPHHEINFVFRAERSNRWAGALEIPMGLEDGIEFLWVDAAVAQDLDIRPQAVKAWIASGMGAGVIEWVSEIR